MVTLFSWGRMGGILQEYQAVLLTIVTMLYVLSAQLIHLITKSLHLLTALSLFPPPPSLWPLSIFRQEKKTKSVTERSRDTGGEPLQMAFLSLFPVPGSGPWLWTHSVKTNNNILLFFLDPLGRVSILQQRTPTFLSVMSWYSMSSIN